jgi:hypothetical protein
MFPWKDFLIAQIRKIQKHKEERDRSGKFKKTRRREWRKEKEDIVLFCNVRGGSHTHVFSICWECPCAGGATRMGNLAYNILLAPLGALIFEMLTFILSCDIKLGIQWVSHENKIKVHLLFYAR